MGSRSAYLNKFSKLHQSWLSEAHCLCSTTQDSTSRCVWRGGPDLLEALAANAAPGWCHLGNCAGGLQVRPEGRQDRPVTEKAKFLRGKRRFWQKRQKSLRKNQQHTKQQQQNTPTIHTRGCFCFLYFCLLIVFSFGNVVFLSKYVFFLTDLCFFCPTCCFHLRIIAFSAFGRLSRPASPDLAAVQAEVQLIVGLGSEELLCPTEVSHSCQEDHVYVNHFISPFPMQPHCQSALFWFVSIYGARAHFCWFWASASTFCHYLHRLRSLLLVQGSVGMQMFR